MVLEIIYEDDSLLVVNKPAGVVVFPEGQTKEGTLMQQLVAERPELVEAGEAPRYGCVHRLDKDTSGVLLVAKTPEALIFFQKQFISRRVEKKYICLVEGRIKEDSGRVEGLLGRSTQDPRKQTVWRSAERAPAGARQAMTEYRVTRRFADYTLLEVRIETGRKHQIRAHMAHIQHPVAGDTLYRFKNYKTPAGLSRQFLHAQRLKVTMPARAGGPNGEQKEFTAPLPQDLQTVLDILS